MALADRLKLARLEKGLRLREAGELARVDQNTIWRYENDYRVPSALALQGLAAIYGKPADWLWREEEYEEVPQTEPSRPTTYVEDAESQFPQVVADRLELLADMVAGAAREKNVSLDYLVGLTDDPTPSAGWAARLSEAEARASKGNIAESEPAYENDSTGRRPLEVL